MYAILNCLKKLENKKWKKKNSAKWSKLGSKLGHIWPNFEIFDFSSSSACYVFGYIMAKNVQNDLYYQKMEYTRSVDAFWYFNHISRTSRATEINFPGNSNFGPNKIDKLRFFKILNIFLLRPKFRFPGKFIEACLSLIKTSWGYVRYFKLFVEAKRQKMKKKIQQNDQNWDQI